MSYVYFTTAYGKAHESLLVYRRLIVELFIYINNREAVTVVYERMDLLNLT